jgi:bifunctional non-homologous end joining protein LigD
MLLRSARLPTSGDYAYEPKWDGFRCLVSRNGRFHAVSRRGWDMTPLLPVLAALSDGLAVDGELVAFGDDGLPSFPRRCDRMLQDKRQVEVMLIVFDVLAIDGPAVQRRPYWERRQLLEQLGLNGDYWSTTRATRTAKRSGSESSTSASRASSPRREAATTTPAAAAGSRPRTATTGDAHWRSRPR